MHSIRLVRIGGTQPQPAPRLRDDNAVRRIAWRIAHLNRQVRPYTVHPIRERTHILRTLIRNTGNPIVVDDDRKEPEPSRSTCTDSCSARVSPCPCLCNHRVHDGPIGDTTGTGKQFTALALNLFGSRLAPREKIADNTDPDGHAEADGSDDPRRPQVEAADELESTKA